MLSILLSAQSILITPSEIDFGIVYFDTVGDCHSDKTETKKIWVSNTGTEPIYITRVNWPGEVCAPTYSRDPIMPNDSGLIVLYCRSFGYEKSLNKLLVIETNVGTHIVKLKGAFKLMPHMIEISACFLIFNSDQVQDGQDITGRFTITNVSNEDVILADFQTSDSALSTSIETVILKPMDSVEIVAFVNPSKASNKMNQEIIFYSSSTEFKERISIPVRYSFRR